MYPVSHEPVLIGPDFEPFGSLIYGLRSCVELVQLSDKKGVVCRAVPTIDRGDETRSFLEEYYGQGPMETYS